MRYSDHPRAHLSICNCELTCGGNPHPEAQRLRSRLFQPLRHQSPKATLTDTVKEGDAALVPMAKPPARHRRPRPRPRSRPGANHLIAKGKRVLVPKLHPDIPSPPNKGVLDYYWGSGSTRPKMASPSKLTTRAPRRKPDPKPQVEEVCIELAIPDENLQQRSWSISTEERRFFPGLGGRCDSTPPSPLSWC